MSYQANQTDSDFQASALSRLTTVNWQNEHHRRSVTASLVQGVYELENARQENRQGCQAWWEFFNFHLLEPLMDDCYSSIFGAVYEFVPNSNNNFSKEAPTYVIAFRGSMLNQDTAIRDMKLNKAILKSRLHRTSCIEKAMKTVEFMVSVSEASKIWLAGHSLGSSVAMLAGKNMAKRGNFLESHLFNPPFVTAPTKRRHIVATCLITAAITLFIRNNQDRQSLENQFSDLSMWVPNLYLHPSDPICSGYIRYFKLREKMERHGVQSIERLAAPYSLNGLLMKAFGKDYCSEELHLIPSACVTTSCSSFLQPHGLDQWFGDDTISDPVVHCYN